MDKFNQEERYKFKALLYAEQHGIIEYHIRGNTMIFYTTWPMEHRTYKAIVNLNTMSERREEMRNYYRPYTSKIGGRWTACLEI